MDDQAPITTSPSTTTRADALVHRYGADAVPQAGPWSPTLDLMLSHRSVRGYRPDALPAGTLETLVAAAQSAATSSNMQTWSVVAVTDPMAKATLARVASNQKHIEQCPLFLVWLADVSRNRRLAASEGTELAAPDYFEGFLVAAIDAALAAQNAVLAAESLGLSTVYIGALRNDPLTVRDVLGLPDGTMGVFGLCVGYAAPEAVGEIKPRLPQDIVLHHGTYSSVAETEIRSHYDAKMMAFSSRNEMAETSWIKRVINRMGTVAALNGRDRLAGTVRAMGFPLR